MSLEEIEKIISKYKYDIACLIPILQDIQREENWLPREHLKYLSKRLQIPETRIYEIATFYKAFSLKERGEHLINACLGTACHVRGATRVIEKIEKELGIKSGETTKDKKFTLETIRCLGACALGPIIVIDNEYHGQMTSVKVGKILRELQQEAVQKEGKEK
jgi:NADH-quinone oxidoreductase subunit E